MIAADTSTQPHGAQPPAHAHAARALGLGTAVCSGAPINAGSIMAANMSRFSTFMTPGYLDGPPTGDFLRDVWPIITMVGETASGSHLQAKLIGAVPSCDCTNALCLHASSSAVSQFYGCTSCEDAGWTWCGSWGLAGHIGRCLSSTLHAIILCLQALYTAGLIVAVVCGAAREG